jgi:hypothetical protein
LNRSVLVGSGGGAVLAASALAAAAWHEVRHRSVWRAELRDDIRIERLRDLAGDLEAIQVIEAGLRNEWGPFAFLGFETFAELSREAGRLVFVASEEQDSRRRPLGSVQLTLASVGGDASSLATTFGTFHELTSAEAFRRANFRGGDTAVLLQLTVFNPDDRGSGLGSLLRDALLHMLPPDVEYALTTTPLVSPDGGATIDLADPSTWTPTMRFHARGGALPSGVLPGYKGTEAAPNGGADIVVMRYARAVDGSWPAARPEMRLRRRGPLYERMARTAAGLGSFSRRGLRTVSRSALRADATRLQPG